MVRSGTAVQDAIIVKPDTKTSNQELLGIVILLDQILYFLYFSVQ